MTNEQGTALIGSGFCRRCGQALQPGDVYCGQCGQPAELTAIAAPVAPVVAATSNKQSGFGIASFILAIVSSALIVISAVFSVNYVLTNGTDISAADTSLVIVGLLFLIGGAGLLASIGLGVAGVVQKIHKKTFAIIGLILSSTATLLIAGLFILSRFINTGN